jgi:hypothetical protein
LHVLADLLGSLIGFGIARFFDNFPKRVSVIREEHEFTFRQQMDTIVTDELKHYESSAIGGINLSESIGLLYDRALLTDPDGWRERAAEHLENVRELHSEFEIMRREYVLAIEELVGKVSGYFSDATKNLARLNMVAGRIKEKAIEPSFELLAKARHSLSDVKLRLQAIEFS